MAVCPPGHVKRIYDYDFDFIYCTWMPRRYSMGWVNPFVFLVPPRLKYPLLSHHIMLRIRRAMPPIIINTLPAVIIPSSFFLHWLL